MKDHELEYPGPTKEDLESPLFEAVWQAIKGWDLSRYNNGLYSGATGNDVMHILLAVRPFIDSTEPIDPILQLVRKHNLAVEGLTEKQLSEAVRQAIACGDFRRMVRFDGMAQQVTYIPHRDIEEVKHLYNSLLYAVATKHPGETRHETALRYIQEREGRTGQGVDSVNTDLP